MTAQSAAPRTAFAAAPLPAASRRIVELVARYPQISGREATEIVAFLKSARYMDIQRLTSDEAVRRQLDIFMRGHRHSLKASATEIVSAVALVVAFLSICWLIWQAAGPLAG